MAEKIRLVQGDTRPVLQVTLTNSTTGSPVNLATCTVKLYFRAVGATVLTTTLTGTVVDAAGGVCQFNWADDPAALAGAPGEYEGEVEVTYAGGEVQTAFELLRFRLREQF